VLQLVVLCVFIIRLFSVLLTQKSILIIETITLSSSTPGSLTRFDCQWTCVYKIIVHGCIQNMGVYKTTIFNLVPSTIASDWKTIRVSEKQW